MATWQIQDAESSFHQLFEDAHTKGPQIITKHGSEIAVLISLDEYRCLKKETDLRALLLGGPKFDDFSIERDQSTDRAIEL